MSEVKLIFLFCVEALSRYREIDKEIKTNVVKLLD